MDYLLKHLSILTDAGLIAGDILISDGHIAEISEVLAPTPEAACVELRGCTAFPGFADVHVHLREPGFSHKETIRTGTQAAAAGGFTAVCAMPNLNPVPDCPERLAAELSLIARDAVVDVFPYGAITVDERGETLSDMAGLAPSVCAFSDDGCGVADDEVMEAAMREAKRVGRLLVAHCEVLPLVRGGCVHDGDWARAHGLPGNPSESEWRQVARDLSLVEKTGCSYHVCHVSTKESVELVRQARRRGLDVTCETAPHYLLLDDRMLRDEGRFRMNPPIRAAADRAALIEGLLDGTIGMIATDHAPHTPAEKSGGLRDSLNGIVGLETAFPVLYTGLVRTGILTLPQLVDRLCIAPRKRFGLGGGRLCAGAPADLTVFALDERYPIDSARFRSKGRATPFDGERVFGRCRLTFCKGRVVHLG